MSLVQLLTENAILYLCPKEIYLNIFQRIVAVKKLHGMKTLSNCLKARLSSPKPSFSLGISLGPFLVPPGLLDADLRSSASFLAALASASALAMTAAAAAAPLTRFPMLGISLAVTGI